MQNIIEKLIAHRYTISTMESCTGGLLASTITNYSGASDILTGAFVTYSNIAKVRQGVPAEIIDRYGVYSAETAAAMAEACARAYDAKIGIGITGSLGRKDPYNPDSVPGQVYYSIRIDDRTWNYFLEFDETHSAGLETREDMKQYVIRQVLEQLEQLL